MTVSTPLLIEAARRLKDEGYEFRLKFVGDGPERQQLENLTAVSGLRERADFLGFLNGRTLEKAVEDVHAIVMPTLMEETAGLAAIEQMMRGRLVVVSDIGGLGEVVDGTGIKFRCGDVDGLTACLRRLLDEPELVEELGRKARERTLALFTERRMVDEHMATYGEVLACRE